MDRDQLAEKVRPFIDLIDDMRSIGIDKELPLPTIAVVGDQSSGKSSVLETLSGVTLPRGTGEILRKGRTILLFTFQIDLTSETFKKLYFLNKNMLNIFTSPNI
uniref:Dynamin N-terminal domain-containing protein n=1 Tax=Salmo trutta TaxID=8032 RepID=A0A673WN11_SALTR